ncbi:MAG: hypothetical protein CME70_06690 [Halobacteriovorax sp.]|nr:hypothetical protein [Halobacteriovorax sp.]
MRKYLNQKGQSTVEYILLLAVIISLALAFLNSPIVKRFVGSESEMMKLMYVRMIYAYRHGRMGEEDESNYEREHETYFDKVNGESRFFAPAEKYP